jgi:hypothetical protein
VIYGAAGQDDEVWISAIRTNSIGEAQSVIERLYPIDWQTYNVGQPQLNEAFYGDCGTQFVSPPTNVLTGMPFCLYGRAAAISIVPASGAGMWSIRGVTFANAAPVCSVTIPNYVPAAGDVVVVGLAINWEIMPMRLDVDPRAGPTPGLTKSIKRLHLRTLNSIGGQWATTAAPPVLGTLSNVIDIQAYPITQNADQPPPFTANIPQDVELDVGGLFGYVKDPEFAIQGYDPLPFFLLGIAIEVDLGGRT